MRVVFDVSVLIRFAMGSTLIAKILGRAAAGEYVVLSNELLVAELAATASKPRLAPRVDRPACDDLLAYLTHAAEHVTIVPPFPNCRDPDDAYLLAMAREGEANYLVTNDEDLLSISTIGICRIITPEVFAEQLGTPRA